MDKQAIYDYLKRKNIWHEITEHKAVYNMADLAQIAVPYPEADAKNLFIRDDKKRNYYLITVKSEIRVKVFLDKTFLEAPGLIGVHPNDNTATVWLRTQDLLTIIKKHGTKIELVRFDAKEDSETFRRMMKYL